MSDSLKKDILNAANGSNSNKRNDSIKLSKPNTVLYNMDVKFSNPKSLNEGFDMTNYKKTKKK